MTYGYLTPDSEPDGTKCIALIVPSGEEWETIIRGALASLLLSYNYQEHGSISPEDTAQFFQEASPQWFQWLSCESEVRMHYVGEIFWVAGPYPIEGTLLCDGQQYLISEYPDLYEAIGVGWGAADSGYFRIPNLAGRMPIGLGLGPGGHTYNLADTGGTESVILEESELPSHVHDMTHQHNIPTSAWQASNAGSGSSHTYLRQTAGTVNTSQETGDTGSTGGDQGHENMPPFLALYPLIQAL